MIDEEVAARACKVFGIWLVSNESESERREVGTSGYDETAGALRFREEANMLDLSMAGKKRKSLCADDDCENWRRRRRRRSIRRSGYGG